MAAANFNLYIEQGTTYSTDIVFKNQAGLPIDQTGRTFRGQIRSRYDSSVIIATFTITLANQVTDTGKINIKLTAAETAAIPVDSPTTTDNTKRPLTIYQYDIEAVNADTTVERVLQGLANVSPEVTK